MAQIQLQTSTPPPNIAFSDPPVFLPPPLEIIIGPAQWIGVKLWSLGRGCCHYLPILPCALRGGFGIFRVQNSVKKSRAMGVFCSILAFLESRLSRRIFSSAPPSREMW